MFSFSKRIGVVAGVGLASLALTMPARAQNPYFQIRPGLSLGQAAYNVATMGQALSYVPPYALGYNPYPRIINYSGGYAAPTPYMSPYASMYANGYAGSPGLDYANSMYNNPYYSPYGYYYDPAGAYLSGTAQVVTAQGQFQVNQMKAVQMLESVRAERIANRRRAFDEYLYERAHMPTPAEERERFLREQLRNSRNNALTTEIWSGKALNDILRELKRQQAKGESASLRTFDTPLDEETLRQINVSKGTGNIGLLKNEGKLSWPVALSGSILKEQREQISSLVQDAVKQAEFNSQVDPVTIRDLITAVDKLQKQLRVEGRDLPSDLYIEGKTYLNNLNDAVSALKQKDVGNFFGPNGKYVIKARTIPDLVKHMRDQGLEFAPATPGGESAYLALHSALVGYDVALRQ
jgi:hypothetical protein